MINKSLAVLNLMISLAFTACFDGFTAYEQPNYVGIKTHSEDYTFYHSGDRAGNEWLQIERRLKHTICTEQYWIDSLGMIRAEICYDSPSRTKSVVFVELPSDIKEKFDNYRQQARENWKNFDQLLGDRK